MLAPPTWLFQQYRQMNDVARHALYLIISKQRAMQSEPAIDESDFGSWLQFEAQTQLAITAWLKHLESPSLQGHFASFISALIQRENGITDWYSGWMRSVEFNMPPDCMVIWPQSAECTSCMDFQVFWRAMAWNEAGDCSKAIETLELHLSQGNNSPQLWLLLASLSAQMHQFGHAEHALAQASEQPPQTQSIYGEKSRRMAAAQWQAFLDGAHNQLAREALQTAKASHAVEPSLLELAMRHGTPNTAAEAALCAFDAQLEDIAETLRILAERRDVLAQFAQNIAHRRDTEKLDELWKFTQKLRDFTGEIPEILYLEALSQLDDTYHAINTLERAITRFSKQDDIFWNAAELWIDLHAQQQTYDEAVRGLLDALAIDDPRSTRTLIYLIARLPKAAYGMLQTMMVEALGRETVHKAFTRVQHYSAPQPAQTQKPMDWDVIAITMMPYAWQLIYRSSRYNLPATPEDNEKNARREQVLAARGIKTNAHDAPEPAQWVHEVQKKASDAFYSE